MHAQKSMITEEMIFFIYYSQTNFQYYRHPNFQCIRLEMMISLFDNLHLPSFFFSNEHNEGSKTLGCLDGI